MQSLKNLCFVTQRLPVTGSTNTVRFCASRPVPTTALTSHCLPHRHHHRHHHLQPFTFSPTATTCQVRPRSTYISNTRRTFAAMASATTIYDFKPADSKYFLPFNFKAMPLHTSTTRHAVAISVVHLRTTPVSQHSINNPIQYRRGS